MFVLLLCVLRRCGGLMFTWVRGLMLMWVVFRRMRPLCWMMRGGVRLGVWLSARVRLCVATIVLRVLFVLLLIPLERCGLVYFTRLK